MRMRDETQRVKRAAAWIVRATLRMWPEETLQWGIALERELVMVEGSRASARWAWGGIMLFTRAWWNHFLRSCNRPIGVPTEGPLADLAKSARRVPRTPRWVTAALLFASVAVLALPDVREAMRTTVHAWTWDEPIGLNPRTLARLRKEARDPQAMALIALVSDDAAERTRMADEAVGLDPSLTWIWIDSQANISHGENCCRYELSAEQLGKLEKWDPDNVVPRLLAAQQRLLRFQDEWVRRGYRGEYNREAAKYMSDDTQWLTAMQFAFQAPKYDSYYWRRFELYRTVAQRYGFRDMGMVREIVVRFFPFWSRNASIYSQILLERGADAERSGNTRQAIELYAQPGQFAARMAQQSHREFELQVWGEMERDSLRRLQPLLAKAGRADEARAANYELAALDTNPLPFWPKNPFAESASGWDGFMIRFLSGAAILLLAVSFASFLALLFGGKSSERSRGIGLALASVTTDYGPVALLAASCGLFAAYRPVVLTYQQYVNWSVPIYDFRGLIQALFLPYATPQGIQRILWAYLNPFHYWMAAIGGLSIAVLYILFRRRLQRTEV